jgi:succinate-semialdehyde dehydrogenase/glutarate-semialdehyde dehydrogenase
MDLPMAITSVNPFSGLPLESFVADGGMVVEAKLAAAVRAFSHWSREPVQVRAALLERAAPSAGAAAAVEHRRESLARLCAAEMGKPVQAAREEVTKCAGGCRFYAAHAAAFLTPELVDGPQQAVWFEPLGVILAVMPWNFPFWQVFRFAAPAIAAGNTALLKHASNVPQCAASIQDVFTRAGAPAGLFQTLLIEGTAVEPLIADPRIAALTLTGSANAGRAVAARAGQQLKKVVLELGGSDPFVVLDSADVERAADTAVKARTVNNGQSCIAAKRFVVVDSVYDRFVTRFVEGMRSLRVGDPLRDDTELGPLATPAIRAEVAEQVAASVKAGARLVLGGVIPPGAGNFYPATVLVDVPRQCPAARDEIFGPVAAVFRVPDASAALALANDSSFGLAASVWTRDVEQAHFFARELVAGMVFVNDMVVSDVRFPFGGTRSSGFGRELGRHGMLEFVNIKTVRMTLGAAL